MMNNMNTQVQLENKCRNLYNEIAGFADEFEKVGLSDKPEKGGVEDNALRREVRKLRSRAAEYEHGSFIALVVGPAKSGKSTLVNLIAGAYVSPTNFLECTVRPSIISKRGEGQESEIVCFTSRNSQTTENSDERDKIGKIDSIIDCIRGLDNERNLWDIKIEKYPLTKENIRDRVELGLEESLTSDTLITSITTPGGSLLHENVFIIDMPGFDGAYKNIDDPIYDVIAQRADLIIFVQSSNAAFNKVSKDFLKILSARNRDVPVCLIHNQFDASWWKTREEKDRITGTQRRFAIDEIRKSGFNIQDENCYTLNLGAVNDFRNDDYKDNEVMRGENERFVKAEEELYRRIINRKDTIRLENCINRTLQQARRVSSLLDSDLADRHLKVKEYRSVEGFFDKLDPKLEGNVEASANLNLAKSVFDQYEHQGIEEFSNDKIKYSNDDANHRISVFVENLNNALNARMSEILNIQLAEATLFNDFRTKASSLREKLIEEAHAPVPEIDMEKVTVGVTSTCDITQYIDLKTIIPKKKVLGVLNFGSHSSAEMQGYITTIINRLTTMKDYNSQTTDYGYFFKEIVPTSEAALKNRLSRMKGEYQLRLNDYIASTRRGRLASIIPDYDKYVATTDSLTHLTNKLAVIR